MSDKHLPSRLSLLTRSIARPALAGVLVGVLAAVVTPSAGAIAEADQSLR